MKKRGDDYKEKVNLKKEAALLPGYILLAIWLLFVVCMVGWIILASFSTTKEILTNNVLASGVHFINYVNALLKHNVARYFLNSLMYAVCACTAVIFVAAPASYVLARFRFWGRGLFSAIFASAMGIPMIMIILPVYAAVNQLRLSSGVPVLLFLYIATTVPFTTIFLLGFFATLPKSLEDAAMIDGCTPIQTFWKVFLPLAQPGIITVTIFNFITVWNEYFMALIFVNKTEQRTLSLGLQSMIQSMRYTGDWAGMFAAIVIVFMPTFILYLFLSEKIIAGVTGGAVKE